MKRDGLIFAVVLLLVAMILLKATMAYPLRSRLFPLITLLAILILLVIQIVREARAIKERSTGQSETRAFRFKDLAIWGWLGGTLIMLWVFGFMGTVVLLPFLYLRFHRESWLISIALPLGCGFFFYTLFGLLLGMPLYQGILFPIFSG